MGRRRAGLDLGDLPDTWNERACSLYDARFFCPFRQEFFGNAFRRVEREWPAAQDRFGAPCRSRVRADVPDVVHRAADHGMAKDLYPDVNRRIQLEFGHSLSRKRAGKAGKEKKGSGLFVFICLSLFVFSLASHAVRLS